MMKLNHHQIIIQEHMLVKDMVATGDKFNNNNQINNQIIKVKVG